MPAETFARFSVAVVALLASPLVAWGQPRLSCSRIDFDRPDNTHQVLVTEDVGGRLRDRTRDAQWTVASPAVVRVDADGLVTPIAEGASQVVAKIGSTELKIPVTVTGLKEPKPVSFAFEVQPILTKARCNSGGCHGKAEGQNGFKLSLLGFDDPFDHLTITKEGKGRRISFTNPDSSLLLRKGTAEIPHGGGLKIEPDSPAYLRLRRWIAAGAPASVPDERPITSVRVEPSQVSMRAGESWQLRLVAIDADGKERCATAEADYISNAGHVVDVSPRGLLQASDIPGEAAILVRYLGHVTTCRVTVPREDVKFARPAEHNFIDKLVWNKLQSLGVQPSDLIDDATFQRRVSLDTIGTLPTAAEARRFLADKDPQKRERLVRELLERPEYADYWAMKWSDILRADKIKVTPQGAVGLTRWLRKQFATNRPFDEMAREILTAQGPVQSESPAAFFKSLDQPEVAGRSVSQLLLGVRIECAQCHHHPSERWSQDDYAGFVGFFTGMAVKKLPDGGEAIVARAGKDQKHPRTGELVLARALGADTADFSTVTDRREVLAAWLTKDDNPFFARAIANRMWAHYFGRGLVEPIDDMRETNPATNEPLLDALAAHLKEVRYDLRAFTRTLLASRVYQLSSETNDSNRDDRQHFSHATAKAMPAEVLLDAICQATGIPEKFNGWPLGVRSIQVWDNRMPSYFFRVFGRPARVTVCECERSNEPSISQALHLLNSPEINAKISHRNGLARTLAESSRSPEEIVDEIYLTTLARFPNPNERALMSARFAEPETTRPQATEDILWAVLNTKEFLYNQ